MAETNRQTTRRIPRGCLFALVAVAVPLAGVIIFAKSAYDGETPVTRCANYKELLDSGLTNSWLPDSIPQSVRNLCEQHSIDTGEVYARFYVAPDEIDRLARGFTEIIQRGTRTWPPENRVFLREEFPCASCSVTQDRMVVNIQTGKVEFTSDSFSAWSLIPFGRACSSP